MAWTDDVRRANETLDWIEARQGPLKPGGYARIETDVRTVRAMAEQDDDARIAEIRENHGATCQCSTPWQCDAKYLLARLDALTAERDALLSELTSYRFDFNVSESHPRLRLREPEYFEANGHRYEKTATCRCCDERYAWGWVGDDGICLHCVDGRADIRAERDALTAERDARIKTLENDLEHALASVGAFRQAIEKVFAKADEHEIDQGGMIVTYVLPCGPLHRAIGLARGTDAGGKLLAERDALAARLAAAEAALFGVALRMDLDDLQGCWCVRPKSGSHEHACVAARAALAGSREQAAGEGE